MGAWNAVLTRCDLRPQVARLVAHTLMVAAQESASLALAPHQPAAAASYAPGLAPASSQVPPRLEARSIEHVPHADIQVGHRSEPAAVLSPLPAADQPVTASEAELGGTDAMILSTGAVSVGRSRSSEVLSGQLCDLTTHGRLSCCPRLDPSTSLAHVMLEATWVVRFVEETAEIGDDAARRIAQVHGHPWPEELDGPLLNCNCGALPSVSGAEGGRLQLHCGDCDRNFECCNSVSERCASLLCYY